MKFQKNPVYGYTKNYPGHTNVLFDEIIISEAYDETSGLKPPEKLKFLAIWDTGASGSVITQKVVDALNLQPTGKINSNTAGGTHLVDTYLVNIYLPSGVNFIGLPVTFGKMDMGPDILIGMDIIGAGDFAITNSDNQTTMTFRVPPVERIDFVQEINEYNKRYGHLAMSDEEKRHERNRNKRERKKNR